MGGTGQFAMNLAAAIGLFAAGIASGFGFATLRIAVALRRARRAGAGIDWIERARLIAPARFAARRDMVFLPAALGGIVALALDPWRGWSPVPLGVATALGTLLGAVFASERLERRLLRDERTPRPSGFGLRSLLALQTLGPFALMLAAVPTRWNAAAAVVLGAGTLFTTVQISGGMLWMLRRAGMLHPPSPRLLAVVQETADRLGVHPRRVAELDSPHANALAFPLIGALLYTRPLLDALDDPALAAVTAHELAHLDEPWPVIAARAAGGFLLVVSVAAIPLSGSFGALAGLGPLVASFAFVFVLARVGRAMELRSDRHALRHEGSSPGTYARALEVMHRLNLIPVVLSSKRTIHPHLYDRLVAAGATPDYPRPAPPPRDALAALPWLLVGTALFFAYLNFLGRAREFRPPEPALTFLQRPGL